MTSPAVTISQDASVVEAARALDRHRVRHRGRRLVVLADDGGLVGIITPIDLLKVYLRSDQEIRDEIVHDVIIHYLGTDPLRVKVAVADGIVTLGGEVEKKSMMAIAVRMARAVDGAGAVGVRVPRAGGGAVDVEAQLSYQIDDDRVP